VRRRLNNGNGIVAVCGDGYNNGNGIVAVCGDG
jgi:hypothetical protein